MSIFMSALLPTIVGRTGIKPDFVPRYPPHTVEVTSPFCRPYEFHNPMTAEY